MKWWHRIALILASCAFAWWRPSVAFAQNATESLNILSDILVKVFVIVDGVLAPFVEGNVLTDPKGESLVASLATIVHNFADFLAQFSILLTGNTSG